jgi:LmbE family N-acetylglucosaminyl deacetylase
MKLTNKKSLVYIPDGTSLSEALHRTTHLAVGAHPDDIEIMAFHGILECYSSKTFTGVVAADGAGSPRAGSFANTKDEEMISIRQSEQKVAADLGRYSALLMLSHPSAKIKNENDKDVIEELYQIFLSSSAETVYLHNLADKHETHVALAIKSLLALRRLPKNKRPKQVWGCEVWRGLDWLSDKSKIVLPVSQREDLALKLCQAHESQVAGGKKYDVGTLGRRHANATFFESHETDAETALSFAMDLSPLLKSTSFDPVRMIKKHIDGMEKEILKNIRLPKVKKAKSKK